MSIELTLEELLHLCPKLGFEVEVSSPEETVHEGVGNRDETDMTSFVDQERWSLPPMTYTGILGGMLKYHYVPEFFVCRKVRDVAASPSV